MNDKMNSKIRGFFKDSTWSIAALLLMNVTAQFIVYPLWARKFGNEVYGNIVYAMSLVNTFSVSVGSSANYARMAESAERRTVDGDYNRILCIAGGAAGISIFGMLHFGRDRFPLEESLLAGILCALTLWRYYADVKYRMRLEYKKYFLYYFVISAGYLFGILFFGKTEFWPMTLMLGELAGLLLIAAGGSIWKKGAWRKGEHAKENAKIIMVLILTNLLSNTVFNGDRILLQGLLGGTAVTIYYLASLMGKTMSLITTPLNSVIIGYLARYHGKFSKKMMSVLLYGSFIFILAGTIAAFLGSHVLIAVLYPQNYDMVKEFFWIANMAQVVYFVTNIITTILLRVAKADCQLKINICYAILFVVLCIPSILWWGIHGFCAALLVVNTIRYGIALIYCYKNVDKFI